MGYRERGERWWQEIGRGHAESHASSRKGGRLGGKASRSAAARSVSAKKAAATRKRNAAAHDH